MVSRKLKKAKSGAYYYITPSGRARFVKKPGRKRKRRAYTKRSAIWKKIRRR